MKTGIVCAAAALTLAAGCAGWRSQYAKEQNVSLTLQTVPSWASSGTNGTREASVCADASNRTFRVDGAVNVIVCQNVQYIEGGGNFASNTFTGTLEVPLTQAGALEVPLTQAGTLRAAAGNEAGAALCSVAPPAPQVSADVSRVLVAGDSWSSALVAETRGHDGWPVMMGVPAALRQGVDGATASDWAGDKDGMLTRALATPCDRVVLSLGGNDMFRAYGDKSVTPAEILAASSALRAVASKFADRVGAGNVYVILYANPYPDRADATAAVIALNALIRLSLPQGVNCIESGTVLNCPDCWANGDYHPSFEGHVRLANLVRENVIGKPE